MNWMGNMKEMNGKMTEKFSLRNWKNRFLFTEKYDCNKSMLNVDK